MRVLHFDCFSGISGDMALAALLDAGAPLAGVTEALDSLKLPLRLRVERVRKGGFAATQIYFETEEQETTRHLAQIEELLERGRLRAAQRELARRIFRRLAAAEAAVHGQDLEQVHFHEVGALDSIGDIVGVAVALDLLAPERITSSPVPTGSGLVRCAHGYMPVPAPGTAELLRGVPLRSSTIQAELTTPTGAAILTSVVQEWLEQPALTIERIGYGAGQRDFLEQPNLLRVFVGTAVGPLLAGTLPDEVWVLETNLDHVSGEVVGYCYERLQAAGAVEVFTTPIFMKKNRPGVLLTVLAPLPAVAAVEAVLFQETGTLGVRRYRAQRDILHRSPCTVTTPWGPVAGKLHWREGAPPAFAPEYESCARLAQQQNLPLQQVYTAACRAWEQQSAAASFPGKIPDAPP